MSDERIIGHFREQARFCVEYGSPFTGDLINRMADDVEANGPTVQVIGEWRTNPRADALALRLTGALHSASLTKRDPVLHALYPAQNPDWRMDEIWPVARAFLERERAWAQGFITSPPQTNETRRAIALLAGFLAFAQHWKGPIDTLEIGASAGLNLNWDRFVYRTQTWSWGQGSRVSIDTDWNGAPPPLVPITVRNRAACDLNPLDVRDEAARLQLKSYIWPDQTDRLARFDGAVALAIKHDTRVDRADAAQWLAQKLEMRAQDAATIVYHSVFLQYPPREAREAIVNAIQDAGAKATSSAPIAWVRLEPEAVTDGIHNGLRFIVDLHTWPTGQRQILAYTDGHVRNVWSA